MNYKLKIHFLNDVTTWRARVPALINMVIIKYPFFHQCRLHSNGNGFKIVQKNFIQSSSNLQEPNQLGFSCQQSPHDLMMPTSIFLYPSSSIVHCKMFPFVGYQLMKWHLSLKLVNLKNILQWQYTQARKHTHMHMLPLSIIWVQIQIWF